MKINNALACKRWAVIAFPVALVVCPGIRAESGISLDLAAGMQHESNAALTSVDEKSDLARIVSVGLGWHGNDSALNGNVDYLVQRKDYERDIQKDETAIDGRAALRWDAIVRSLDFILQHQVSQSTTNSRLPDSTNNRERRSILTGGADGYLNFSTVDSLIVSPRYSTIQFDESTQSNSNRAGVGVGLEHRLNKLSALNLLTNYTEVRFDQSVNDYNSTSAEVSYDTTLSRLNYTLAAGYTSINREHLQKVDDDGYSLRLIGNYRADVFEFGGSLVRELTDTSIGLSDQAFSIANFTANDSNFNQVDILTRTQADLHGLWHWSVGTQLNAAIGVTKDDYRVLASDQDEYYGQVGIARTVNSYWRADLSARYTKTRFLDDPLHREYGETYLVAGLNYQLNSKCFIRVQFATEDRSSNISSAEYGDKIASVSINYKAL